MLCFIVSGATQDGPSNEQGASTVGRKFFRKEKLNGSEKRKKKNAKKTSGSELEKAKKQDSEVDGPKKQAAKQPLEEEKKVMPRGIAMQFHSVIACRVFADLHNLIRPLLSMRGCVRRKRSLWRSQKLR